ncbi:protein-associating with the carboxyl-terminal domain of ezrin-like [Actinia tenebrosa]|uniref:Protein-associating with the carboxyl-terminal domain of ezrin-like n=1 Tax=Actinia tenebrosa TaxID=6105 RepID=A0A6P8IRD0_ACTTE|nr:protein-associating with the carboxyl-terminal domain of ezrin-like [Actinia tenebrosa]
MGSECSVYKDYELEEPLDTSNSDWILYPAHSKATNTPVKRVTIFVHEKNKNERKKGKSGLTNSSQFLKVLRHPAILKYYGSYENSEVVMVTEPVQPLENVLHELDVDEIIAGLYNIVQALVFLHEKGDLSHNNVSLSSIYVSDNDGSWKLGGMQCVCKSELVTKQFLEDIKPLRDIKAVAPDEKEDKVTLTAENKHCIDAYGFGMLVSDILDSRDDLGTAGDRFGELMQTSFLNTEPKMRPELQSLLSNDYFKNDYLEVVTFLSNITIKSDIDKDKFFSSLASKLQNISPSVIARRLLTKLMSRFVMAEPSAEKEFLPHLLTPGTGMIQHETDNIFPVLPLDLFRQYCTPILKKLWVIKDLHIRIMLLKFFPLFSKAFEVEDLEKVVLPQILIGLRDTNDSLVSATFYALATLVPILGGEVVVGGERQKYFIEGRPKFSLGSSQQVEDHRQAIFSSSGNQRKKSITSPLNVSQALSIERNLEKINTNIKRPERNDEERHKRKMEMEKRRNERRIERELKKAERERKRAELDKNEHKTLLEMAKEHRGSAKFESQMEGKVESQNEGLNQSGVSTASEDFEEWEDFQMGDSSSKSNSSSPSSFKKDKTSPTRFTPTSMKTLERFDLTDVDFTPNQAQGSSKNLRSEFQSSDLISWDTFETAQNPTSRTSQPKSVATGKAMKLNLKKGNNTKMSKAKAKPVDDLGKMFEVPDFSVKSSEPDFFSDMQPQVEFKSYDGGIGGGNVKSAYSKKMDVSSTSQGAQVGADWDVDEDWTDFE